MRVIETILTVGVVGQKLNNDTNRRLSWVENRLSGVESRLVEVEKGPAGMEEYLAGRLILAPQAGP